MKKLLYKEIKLAASPLSFIFIAAAFLTFVPGYPILLGACFTNLGIFYSFQTTRENNDISFSLLLPVAKADAVKSKFAFTVLIECCSFVLMTVITLIRMLFLKDFAVYTSNALMCANLTFLGFALLIFGLFNAVFLGGFFKTAYYFGKPFIKYCIAALVVIAAAETLHHLPGLDSVNAFGFDGLFPQIAVLGGGVLLFAVLTVFGLKKSEKSFERIDL